MLLSHNKKTLIFIAIAFIFSFSIRLLWIENFSQMDTFKYNNEFMINTNDGYYYAEGARDILAGKTEATNDLSPIQSALSILTALLAKILPISFETLILYMPSFFGSLVVIPLILIGRTFEKEEVGFIAALIASIAVSYYNRTMIGYYDTDMLNIVLPTFLLWSLIWAINTKKDIYIMIAALDILIYRWWYPQSIALEFAFVGMIVIYTLYELYCLHKDSKKEELKVSLFFSIKLMSILLIAMMNMDVYIRIAAITIFFIFFRFNKNERGVYIALAVAFLAFLLSGGADIILNLLKLYVFRENTLSSTQGVELHFFNVIQTVREAGKISFDVFATRISGQTITLVIGILGYVWFAYKHKIILLSLPMVGLGFLALNSGLRFTIYAVPIMALGVAFVIYELSLIVANQLKSQKVGLATKYTLIIVATLAVLYPNIKHIQAYMVPTVLNKYEAEVLVQLGKNAQREDYTVAWWDYGYPIRYYSDVKTLIDGGKHSGNDNFAVSYALSQPQQASANIARMEVEMTEQSYKENNTLKGNTTQMAMQYFKMTDPNKYLALLNHQGIPLPEKTRDIYFYLPYKMLDIYSTVNLFSNLDLSTGVEKKRPFFYQTATFKNNNGVFDLGNNILFDTLKSQLQVNNQVLNISTFSLLEYQQNGKLAKNIISLDTKSNIHVIYLKSYNKFLVMDSNSFLSTYIQLFLFENYDKNLFEPVVLNPFAKVYKLKI